MIRLWQYWPVRHGAVLIFGALAFSLGYLAADSTFATMDRIPREGETGILAMLFGIAGLAVLVAIFGQRLKALEQAVPAAPAKRPSYKAILLGIGGFILATVLGVAAVIVQNVLGMGLELALFEVRVLVAPLAVFVPFLFIVHARPRNRRHWIVLGLGIPTIYIASLASLPAAAFVLSAAFPANPGSATATGLIVFAFLALNAPVAVLLLKSGACPPKDRVMAGANEEALP